MLNCGWRVAPDGREDNIKMNLKEVRWEGVDRIGTDGTLCEHSTTSSGSIKGNSFLTG